MEHKRVYIYVLSKINSSIFCFIETLLNVQRNIQRPDLPGQVAHSQVGAVPRPKFRVR